MNNESNVSRSTGEMEEIRHLLAGWGAGEQDDAEQLLRHLCSALRQAGVEEVEVRYSGLEERVGIESVYPYEVDLDPGLQRLVELWSLVVLPDRRMIGYDDRVCIWIDVEDVTASIEHRRYDYVSEDYTIRGGG